MVRVPLLQTYDVAVGHRGDDEAALRVEREAVRPDQENREAAADGLVAHVLHIVPGVPALFEENGQGIALHPFVDYVGGVVAEEQVSGLALRDPDRAFGQSEVLAKRFQFRVRRDDLVEPGVETDDAEFCSGRRLRM